MYVVSVPNRGYTPTVLIRESYRENGKVKNRTIANITDWPEAKIEALRQLLKSKDGSPALTSFEIERSLPFGHAAAALGTLHKLGLDKVLCSKRSRERDLCVAMIVERVLQPASKAAMADGLRAESRQSALADLLELGDDVRPDELYEAMDWLLRRQRYIEKKLAKRHLQDGCLVLFDLTSTWMEGKCCPLAKHGYSRDGKPGKKQIEFGLLTDQEGRPIAVEVFEGNVSDPQTLSAAIDRVRKRFGLERVVVVGDRGMITQTRIREELEPQGLDFITCLRKPTIRRLMDQGELQLSLFDEQDLAQVELEEFPGERLIMCRNPLQAEDQKRRRWGRINKAFARLREVKQAVERENRPIRGVRDIALRVGRVFGRQRGLQKFFTIEIEDDQLSFEVDEERVAAEERLDGLYVVRTSVEEERLGAPDVVRTYKCLSGVEQAFRSIKTVDLDVRPVRHYLPDRVRAHVLLCMLSLYLKQEMERALAPLLFVDEHPEEGAERRTSVVAAAEASEAAKKKARTRRTADGRHPVQGFHALLRHLATQTRNLVVPKDAITGGFWTVAKPTDLQQRAYKLLGVDYARL